MEERKDIKNETRSLALFNGPSAHMALRFTLHTLANTTRLKRRQGKAYFAGELARFALGSRPTGIIFKARTSIELKTTGWQPIAQ
jgi:hypothetical protein